MTDTSARPKRRGREVLLQAVRQAMLDELVERGYGEVSIEGVAARAGAAKTSVYRHWGTKEGLVIDALRHALPVPDQPADTGHVREDFLVMLRRMSASLDGLTGQVLLTVAGERRRHPEIAEAVVDEIVRPRQRLFLAALERAAERGQISGEAVTSIPIEVASSLMLQHYIYTGTPPGEERIQEFLDRAIMPLVTYARA
ncbi:TetR/AcrR family transcriptional regulator [Nonomuraea sp. NPDC048882]|uniref:TetR/AcrR family transcriptional regulator n=1 Tax=Nonomuraea sp. NPDC048882 TaxID=3154347 RepID=UPI000B194FC4